MHLRAHRGEILRGQDVGDVDVNEFAAVEPGEDADGLEVEGKGGGLQGQRPTAIDVRHIRASESVVHHAKPAQVASCRRTTQQHQAVRVARNQRPVRNHGKRGWPVNRQDAEGNTARAAITAWDVIRHEEKRVGLRKGVSLVTIAPPPIKGGVVIKGCRCHAGTLVLSACGLPVAIHRAGVLAASAHTHLVTVGRENVDLRWPYVDGAAHHGSMRGLRATDHGDYAVSCRDGSVDVGVSAQGLNEFDGQRRTGAIEGQILWAYPEQDVTAGCLVEYGAFNIVNQSGAPATLVCGSAPGYLRD